jgi:hypothetical protein
MEDNYFTLSNESYSVKVSPEFVFSCKVFTNMFEDTGDNDNSESIPITNKISEEDLKMYIKFFEDMSNIKVENNNGIIMSYLDYINDFRDEYIENYTNKDLDPPHTDKVYEIYNSLNEEQIIKIIEIDKFLDNKKIIRGIMLCIAISIRILDRDIDYDNEEFEDYKNREGLSSIYIDSIMDCLE